MNLPILSILQVRNPVDFDGIKGNPIPSNSMKLKRTSMPVTVFSNFTLHHSSFAAGVSIPFETKMTEMSQTLYAQMAESDKLDTVIRENLEALGYGR